MRTREQLLAADRRGRRHERSGARVAESAILGVPADLRSERSCCCPGRASDSRRCSSSLRSYRTAATGAARFARGRPPLSLRPDDDSGAHRGRNDRVGLVKALADVVSRHGGSWPRSQLAELVGTFAGVSWSPSPIVSRPRYGRRCARWTVCSTSRSDVPHPTSAGSGPGAPSVPVGAGGQRPAGDCRLGLRAFWPSTVSTWSTCRRGLGRRRWPVDVVRGGCGVSPSIRSTCWRPCRLALEGLASEILVDVSVVELD